MANLTNLVIPDGLDVSKLLEVIGILTDAEEEDILGRKRPQRIKDARYLFTNECYSRGCSYDYLSKMMGVTRSAIGNRLQFHRERLRSCKEYSDKYKSLKNELNGTTEINRENLPDE